MGLIVRRRGFTEKTLYAFNPLPNVTDAEVLERAGLELTQPSTVHPFELAWQYASGAESEYVRLLPGQSVVLRESEATDMRRELSELGLAVVEDLHDETAVRRATADALRRAAAYWRPLGKPWLAKYRRDRGISADDVKDMRHQLHPYFIAQAKMEILEDALRELERTPKDASGKFVKRAAA